MKILICFHNPDASDFRVFPCSASDLAWHLLSGSGLRGKSKVRLVELES